MFSRVFQNPNIHPSIGGSGDGWNFLWVEVGVGAEVAPPELRLQPQKKPAIF